ncbi:hypothetical protein MRB53_021088 [Persea americana]|uniref:Uncharacterized protein n=1 Tax=Persea americana TaxID=3435 RepID=A0ACC2L317_PERAE|nr:hypothetical protein MRB53_021088 [Persea americana]
MGDGSNSSGNRPAWLQQYDLVGKIGEGTYGLVFLANEQAPFQQGQVHRHQEIQAFKGWGWRLSLTHRHLS